MPMRLQAIDRFLVVVLGLVFIGLSLPVKAKVLSLEDYKITPPCKEQLDAAKISTFEILEDEINLVGERETDPLQTGRGSQTPAGRLQLRIRPPK